MTRLRSYAPMKRKSDKVKKAEPDFRKVYRIVDARSEGRCEWVDAGDTALPGGRRPDERCPKRATDHNHLDKPRRSHHEPAVIIHLCRAHHDRADWPYPRGKAVMTPLGAGRFHCEIRYEKPAMGDRRGGHYA